MTNEQILREALENICKHIETIAGDMTRHSSAYAIAKAALKATEPQEKCPECYKGKKQIGDPRTNPNSVPGGDAVWIDCPTCKGTGVKP